MSLGKVCAEIKRLPTGDRSAMNPPTARTWAEIDLAALRHNVATVRRHTPGAGIMAVVKANAYGHGVLPVARALWPLVEMLAVANLEEAGEIHAALPEARIFLLGPALPEERAEILRSGFIPALSTWEEAVGFHDLAPTPFSAHLVIDTGMGRIGVTEEDAVALATRLRTLPRLQIAGVASHLPVADEDDAFTAAQLERFHQLVARLRAVLPGPLPLHVLNSAGILHFEHAAGDLVRAGLMLYGSSPIPALQRELQPVLTWKTRVTLVRAVAAGRSISYGRTYRTPRPMRIATLAVGYADGYQRHLSGRGAEVLIHGRRCAMLGRVTMDQIMVDVSALGEVQPGDEAGLIGRQENEEILAAELAEKAGTIAWEIFTGLGPRVERRYVSE